MKYDPWKVFLDSRIDLISMLLKEGKNVTEISIALSIGIEELQEVIKDIPKSNIHCSTCYQKNIHRSKYCYIYNVAPIDLTECKSHTTLIDGKLVNTYYLKRNTDV